MKAGSKFTANEIYALAFGLFLGLCILKFGNPVILDQKIYPPISLSDYWNDAWPPHWVNFFLLPLAVVGLVLMVPSGGAPLPRQPGVPQSYPKWLFILPLIWFGWQVLSATQTVDGDLTATTLWQFSGCIVCYFIGAFLVKTPRAFHLLLVGILAAFVICLVHAIHQHLEFPETRRFMLEGQRTGWTNFPPEMLMDMQRDGNLINTNGALVINPALLERISKDRVMGTLVYPNALAGIILLLFPVSIVLAVNGTKNLRRIVSLSAIGLTVALSVAAFVWSGSKFGWLIAIFMGGLCLFRLPWPARLKILALTLVAVIGLGIFAVRFHTYFAHGATSATARLDYWRAAVQTACSHPLFGTGPGTFQRPYAQLKPPNAEMARLAHNDYLEQFSDSGLIGGIVYSVWIIAALFFIGRAVWKARGPVTFAIFLGLLGWFIQGLGEFELFIPALAWTAFVLLGCLLGWQRTGAESASFPAHKTIRQNSGHG